MQPSSDPAPSPRRNGFKSALESKRPRRLSFLDYRRFIRDRYDGLAGKLTGFTGFVTGHETLAGRLIRPCAFDLSHRMLSRAHRRLRNRRVTHVSADLTRLPYPDAFFDACVCGWVLEHLPDPIPGLRELARVLQPGGKLLLLVTEDTITGTMCSRMWHCRTHNRVELRRLCQQCGLRWERPLWFSRLHALLRLGGIIVELRRE